MCFMNIIKDKEKDINIAIKGAVVIKSLAEELVLRVVLVVAIIDTIAFTLLNMRVKKLTIPFEIGIVVITLVVLVINILFCLKRRGLF